MGDAIEQLLAHPPELDVLGHVVDHVDVGERKDLGGGTCPNDLDVAIHPAGGADPAVPSGPIVVLGRYVDEGEDLVQGLTIEVDRVAEQLPRGRIEARE